MAVPPLSAMMSCRRAATSSSASSQLTRANWPEPFGAGAAQGMEDALRAVDALQVGVDLGAEAAAGDGVVGVADELDGDAVLDRHLPGAGIGAIVRAAAADDAGEAIGLGHG